MKDFSKNVKNWFLQGEVSEIPKFPAPTVVCGDVSGGLERDMLHAWLQTLLQVRELLLAVFYMLLIFYIGNI